MAATAAFAALTLISLVSLAAAGRALRRSAQLERRLGGRPARSEPPPSSARSLQNVGIVRFNPYHDTGGDYSFALALLDGTGSGVLITGLYHRDRCRVYAKPVHGWRSPFDLMDEERQAIDQARGRAREDE